MINIFVFPSINLSLLKWPMNAAIYSLKTMCRTGQ